MFRYISKWMNQKSQSDLQFGTNGVIINLWSKESFRSDVRLICLIIRVMQAPSFLDCNLVVDDDNNDMYQLRDIIY